MLLVPSFDLSEKIAKAVFKKGQFWPIFGT